MIRNKVIAVSGLVLALLLTGYFYKKYRVAPPLEIASMKLIDIDGNIVHLESFAEKNLFLNFFATWCGPCMRELPALAEAQAVLAQNDFKFILISDEPVQRLRVLQQSENFPFLILRSQKKLSDYEIFTLPTSYLLNKEKQVVFKKVQTDDWASPAVTDKLRKLCE